MMAASVRIMSVAYCLLHRRCSVTNILEILDLCSRAFVEHSRSAVWRPLYNCPRCMQVPRLYQSVRVCDMSLAQLVRLSEV